MCKFSEAINSRHHQNTAAKVNATKVVDESKVIQVDNDLPVYN